MKLLGMIGGTSWHSTVDYYRWINELVGKEIGESQNPPLLLYSINIQLMREQNKEKIQAAYLEISQKLQTAGAEAIIICANTPHMIYEYVQPKINIPILHIAEAVGRSAKSQGLKKLGLLGNRPTMTLGFIPEYLKTHYQIETITPNKNDFGEIHRYISEDLTQGKFTEEAKKFFIHQMLLLEAQGAEGIILGCTELPMLLSQKDFLLPLLETSLLHAHLAADFILS
ncbi:MAG: aspartate racemase [Flavobacteriaceae bacterium CG_4_8_14_3_um_filter_34_10]|nr:amino acid racemase [Flavobacteriia bacterium]OIP52017.1 MAG: aspartate racemase [Flavobacteriaceae bacterium CG2_30_34_30]PIQ17459.1 MAG: aspartate racemase [Flavobacteriaceae bacterium CG18_big_fil_WC_8_21_14_2_50_34_36]PIV51710.1 MAG: aspartate racemase [Flavobacteriaceae bacterium CG02_land_8_20_14_3_00_34_13]PIX09335.1 MAG: aspartate racemase [Flavobacteriaceae bacterium CG_4_8_14_3_um_filter_34_10]PIZ07302.1 MAG: aspartate racemase [Flavobacteriaceae bacterium CG_4_10_14_0_8_um_filter